MKGSDSDQELSGDLKVIPSERRISENPEHYSQAVRSRSQNSLSQKKIKDSTQPVGFEPTRGDPNGFRVHRLNHSATTATCIALIRKLTRGELLVKICVCIAGE
ncbi:hypothetical protein CDAR_305731 [Caerostris darwini]|uniref:Uncharacterized protein n=1 Tax=Caerostris darwini TaxID=1538125 RepID=A0AAV4VT99_9ARAC|nr:hypothetical protein CDAR_305731 [Caerostris darwini]